jgi:hypothetical protein
MDDRIVMMGLPTSWMGFPTGTLMAGYTVHKVPLYTTVKAATTGVGTFMVANSLSMSFTCTLTPSRVTYSYHPAKGFTMTTTNLHLEKTEAMTQDSPYSLANECVTLSNGCKQWRKDGLIHRVDGPAEVHPNGSKVWIQNGLLHRVGGPAIEFYPSGNSWYIQGRQFTIDEYYLFVDQTTGEVFVPPGKKLLYEIQF